MGLSMTAVSQEPRTITLEQSLLNIDLLLTRLKSAIFLRIKEMMPHSLSGVVNGKLIIR